MNATTMKGRALAAAAALVLAAMASACASVKRPAALTEAEQINQRLAQTGANARVEADMIRLQNALAQADLAVHNSRSQAYADDMGYVALQYARAAEARDARTLAQRAADSLRTARLNRLLSLTEAQRSSLAQQQQLSQAEIAALRERNMSVTQQAESLSMTAEQLRQRNDSLRRAAEAANAQLNEALGRLRSLVAEITNLRETSRGIVISLSDILFDVNKATLKSGASANVGRIATILAQYPDKQISVEGHTDATGSDAYNQKLSEDRAASVREALVAGGVDASKISSRGFGKTQPVATNATAEGRQQNRRVEIVVLGAGTVADAARSDSTAKTPPR
ncbi:MAG TPA: OmpA family protein [Gemmatimonadaceae bacterium]|nr:OmpA family protein [Gemmatimonadaceae bacterium]